MQPDEDGHQMALAVTQAERQQALHGRRQA